MSPGPAMAEAGPAITALACLLLTLLFARLIQLEILARRRARSLVAGSQALKEEVVRRAQMEEALRSSQTRFRAVAQSTGDAIVSIDNRGLVVFWGGSAERLFGYSEAEAINQPLTFIMPERYREAHRRGLDRMATGGEPRLIGRTVEMVGLTKGGQEIPVDLSLGASRTGTEWIYTGVMRDLSDRRLAEEALVQLAAIERKKEEFVSTVSHELRTPLTTIKGFIELIAGGDAGPVTDTQREFLEIAARSTDRLADLINDLLERGGIALSSRGSAPTEGPSQG